MTREQIGELVDERWRAAFWTFIDTGDASREFFDFLDQDERTQRAVDEALRAAADQLRGVGPAAVDAKALPPAERLPRRAAVARYTSGPAFARTVVAASLVVALGSALSSWYWFQRADITAQQKDYLAKMKSAGERPAEAGDALREWRESLQATTRKALEDVKSSDPKVAAAGAAALAELGPQAKDAAPDVVVELQARQDSETDPAVAGAMAEAIRRIIDAPAADGGANGHGGLGGPWPSWVTVYLPDKPPPFVERARDETVEAQAKKLTAGDPGERREAAKELGALGRKARKAVPALMKQFREEKDMEVNEAVGLALKGVDLQAAEAAGVGLTGREQAQAALQAREEELERTRRLALAAGLHDLGEDSPDTRLAAAQALAQMGPAAQVVGPELRFRLRNEKDERVRRGLEEALIKIDPVEAAKTQAEGLTVGAFPADAVTAPPDR